MAVESQPSNDPPQAVAAAGKAAPRVPDHVLLRRVAKGAYGEVWIARNSLGTYRAVKIVRRSNFEDSRPYDREFAGIRRFEPVSREHPGVVDILQVGSNEPEGYFYYVMELADDVHAPPGQPNGKSGAAVADIEKYRARTLSYEIQEPRRLSAEETLVLGISLAKGLEWLHSQGLVHRDIKPSNIIFVGGEPKLADVGLVAELGNPQSWVGTAGFIPPEGPGSAQADIYSLGKVLYEALTGKDRGHFPELHTNLETGTGGALSLDLNEVVLNACAPNPAERYSSAAELATDLEVLRSGRSLRDVRVWKKRRRSLLVTAVLPLLLAALLYGMANLSSASMATLLGLAVGGVGACALAAFFVARESPEVRSRLRFELTLARASLAETLWPAREIPSVALLSEWRAAGRVRRAYQTSLRYLDPRQSAVPMWFFAAETAALHLKDARSAFHVVRRFCRCRKFSDEQKKEAIGKLRVWGGSPAYDLDLLQVDGLTARQEAQQRVEDLRREGDYPKAEKELLAMVSQHPRDLLAHILLARLYACDLHDRSRAMRVIEQFASRTTVDPTLAEELRRSVDRWLAPGGDKLPLPSPDLLRQTETEQQPVPETDTMPDVLSPVTKSLVLERRLGTAVEHLEKRLRSRPNDLGLLLELIQVHVVHCNSLTVGERILKRICASDDFSPEQQADARAKFTAWREVYKKHAPRWWY